jgi:phosphoglycolate phosphatase-like HAD superfamily hydrolase
MRLAGISDADIDAQMETVIDRYIAGLQMELSDQRRQVKMYDGVAKLIDTVHERDDLVLGLLTGNIEPGARLKLSAVGLDFTHFRINAFGSDHETRSELPAVAHRRMRDTFGVELAGRDVIVIGDTPADVQCGRALGVRAIAVATGRYSVDDLRAYEPYAVFENLGDTAAVLDVIDA